MSNFEPSLAQEEIHFTEYFPSPLEDRPEEAQQ
jgi:hypothetical protein